MFLPIYVTQFSDSTPTPLPTLDRFAYTPKRSLLPAMDKAADTPVTTTPRTTTTTTTTPNHSTMEPQRATGWEHLDFYRHQRERELSESQPDLSHGAAGDVYGNDDDGRFHSLIKL